MNILRRIINAWNERNRLRRLSQERGFFDLREQQAFHQRLDEIRLTPGTGMADSGAHINLNSVDRYVS